MKNIIKLARCCRGIYSGVPKPTGRKRVFIIVNTLSGGGAQRVASILASGLSKTYTVTVVTFVRREVKYPVDDAVEFLEIPMGSFGSPLRTALLSRLKHRRHPDVSISFMFDANLLNVSSDSIGKTICAERNNPAKKSPETFPLTIDQYRRADHVIFQSETVRVLYPEDVRSHSTILPNPVRVSCDASPNTADRIVTAGRLHPQKNHALLLRAFALFLETHPNYELSIYGDGDLKEELRAFAAALGIADHVLFHGNVRSLHEQIADAKMFVLPSDYEGLSNALLEAMMMGLPCISTACEGSTDVIESGRNGLLVPVGDADALCAAMCQLADNNDLRDSIAKAGKETGALFSVDHVIQQWVDVIERVTSEC